MNPERNIQEESPRHRIEISSEMVDRLRTHIDESHDLVIYKNPGDEDEYDLLEENKVKVVIQNPKSGEYILDFSDFARPSDPNLHLTFESDEYFWSLPEEHRVMFPPENLKDPRELFLLLHEIGHVRDTEKQKLKNPLYVGPHFQGSHDTPPDVVYGSILQTERNAWAEAIRLARQIKKDYSINLFASFEDVDDFMGWYRVAGLRSYEEEEEMCRRADALDGIPYTGRKKAYTKDKQVEAAKLRGQRSQEWLSTVGKVRNDLEEQQLFE